MDIPIDTQHKIDSKCIRKRFKCYTIVSQKRRNLEENPTLQRNVIYDRLYITFCCFMSFRRKRASFYGMRRRREPSIIFYPFRGNLFLCVFVAKCYLLYSHNAGRCNINYQIRMEKRGEDGKVRNNL